MWFNTAACDHPVTLPAPAPLRPPRGPNQSHQTHGEQGLWGRASPGAARGLYTNTSLARNSVPSTLQGQGDAHPAGSRMETFKTQKMLYSAPVRSLWRLEGAVGPGTARGRGGRSPSQCPCRDSAPGSVGSTALAATRGGRMLLQPKI